MTPRTLIRTRPTAQSARAHGFTLVELMVAVAIIGILAAVALPAYQDYAKRSRVTEGLSLASGAKTAVTEFYVNNGKFPTTNDAAGLPSKIAGRSVSDVQVGANGAITVTFNEKVEADTQLTLTPKDGEGSINWACASAATKGVKAAYLPSECKPDATV